jgi:hypothetical protein
MSTDDGFFYFALGALFGSSVASLLVYCLVLH